MGKNETVACPKCKGEGQISDKKCKKCKGEGTILLSEVSSSMIVGDEDDGYCD